MWLTKLQKYYADIESIEIKKKNNVHKNNIESIEIKIKIRRVNYMITKNNTKSRTT